MFKKQSRGGKQDLSAAAAALVLAAALLCGCLFDFGARCAALRNDVIRLHIVANSDNTPDQTVKLLVRDAVLLQSEGLLRGADTPQAAEDRIRAALPALAETARRTLAENGFSYGASAELEETYFDTRAYGDVTLPAGTYLALRIRLGTGKGHNWWCVMFPPLCLPAAGAADGAEAFGPRGRGITDGASGYRIRFRLVEIAEWVAEKLRG